MTINIITIVGARPQFIKAATVSRAIKKINSKGKTYIKERIVHTGQHHDENMSHIFFEQLEIPRPDYDLGISGGGHGSMTGQMLEKIEVILEDHRPDWVLVYGDTNSTLAGALAASKLHIPIAHVEAGLRSFNMRMPEEINRILSDRISTMLLCPTQTAVTNLAREGITNGVQLTGDVMYDACLLYKDKAALNSRALENNGLKKNGFILATCHRAENTDSPDRLREISKALAKLSQTLPVVFPLHPRTRKLLTQYGLLESLSTVMLLDPVPYLDMVQLESNARLIVTDSGGIQKEAFFYSVPCVTLRDETEWVETVELGVNKLAGANSEVILNSCKAMIKKDNSIEAGNCYGDGSAADKIVNLLTRKI